MNPVRSGLVKSPDAWQWSSYRATTGLSASPSFLSVSATLNLFGDAEPRVLRERFSAFVIAQPEDPVPVDRIRSNEQILGSLEFKERVTGGRLEVDDEV